MSTTLHTPEVIESVRQYIDSQLLAEINEVAEQSQQILAAITSQLTVGMTETQAMQLVKDYCLTLGIEQQWHKPYIYFGENTLLTYRHKHETDRVLQASDIVYLDIAPIIRGMEGDVGHTVVFGDNPTHLAIQSAVDKLFEDAVDYWRSHQPTGIALYEWIYEQTAERGYQFILDGPGHLVGAFPHKRWPGGLNTYPFTVESGVWILELQIRHPHHPLGAFKEALLVK